MSEMQDRVAYEIDRLRAKVKAMTPAKPCIIHVKAALEYDEDVELMYGPFTSHDAANEAIEDARKRLAALANDDHDLPEFTMHLLDITHPSDVDLGALLVRRVEHEWALAAAEA
jgi:hypothetical protein